MRLTCPSCGAQCSLEAWSNDATSRTFMSVLVVLPKEIQDLVLPYLGLFRKGKQGLAWPRALRLIADLKTLIEAGTVQWDNGEVRPAPPRLWAQALDATLTRRPQGLANHNYLRRCAWEMAAGMASQAEHAKYERDRQRQAGPSPEPTVEDESASAEEREAVSRMLSEFTTRHRV